jgi:hypothetical protein
LQIYEVDESSWSEAFKSEGMEHSRYIESADTGFATKKFRYAFEAIFPEVGNLT